MTGNRFRDMCTVVVFGTFLVVQWNCNARAKNNMQQRQIMTEPVQGTTAANQSLLWSFTVSLSSKNNNITLAQDKRQSNETVGIRKVPSLLSAPVSASHSKDHEDRPTTTIMYSKAKSDRTGAALQDMPAAHAFCYARNWTYGGACEPRKSSHDLPQDVMENQQAQQNMIQALGLDKVLSFACPATVNGNHSNDRPHVIYMAPAGTYMNQGTSIFTSTWLKYIRSLVMQNGRLEEHRQQRRSSSAVGDTLLMVSVAVHVRRGDINPCYPYFKARYLTNSYYLNVLDRYLPAIKKKNDRRLDNHDSLSSFTQVSIYSEKENFEGWDQFTIRNYSMHLDTHLIDDVFFDLLTADVLIMSWSSFSLVAAILNPYAELVVSPTNKWHRPMSNWVLATKEYEGMKTLQFTCPDKKSSNSSVLR